MKKNWFGLALIAMAAGLLLFAGCSSDNNNDNNNQIVYSITVTSPSGGVTWLTGAPYMITWTDENVDSFDIALSTNDGTDWTNIATAVGGNSYMWTAPTTPSTACKIRVLRMGDANTYGTSAAFIIGRPAMIGGWNATASTLEYFGVDSMTFAFHEDLTYSWYQLVNLLDTELTESGTYYAQGDSCYFHATLRDEPVDEHYTRWFSLSQNQNFLTLQYDDGQEIYDMNFNRIVTQ